MPQKGVQNKCRLYAKLINDKDENNLSHFIQAELFAPFAAQFKKKIYLPLMLFYDEFECNNPLGSHAGVDKLGAIYTSLMCLPPEFHSKLENCFVTLLCNGDDRKEFGNRLTFSPLIQELKELLKTPIYVTTKGQEVFLAFFLLTGDNLGLHEVQGFVASFVANFPCRICNMPKWLLQTSNKMYESLLRTVDSYNVDLLINDVSKTGINEECVFNEISTFHCILNAVVDIMHDIYEGVCRYVLCKLIIYYNKVKKYFTYKQLNNLIGAFNFGLILNGDRPPFIKKKKVKKKFIRIYGITNLLIYKVFWFDNWTYSYNKR